MNASRNELVIVWLRRDLRLRDNRTIDAAVKSGKPILPLFIFDTNILEPLDRRDARVEFIHNAIEKLDRELHEQGGCIRVEVGRPVEVFARLLQEPLADPARTGQSAESGRLYGVYAGEDFEPYARWRDHEVSELLASHGFSFYTVSSDQVVFHPTEVLKRDGTAYNVFTPYAKAWKRHLAQSDWNSDPNGISPKRLVKPQPNHLIPSLQRLGFTKSGLSFPDPVSLCSPSRATS